MKISQFTAVNVLGLDKNLRPVFLAKKAEIEVRPSMYEGSYATKSYLEKAVQVSFVIEKISYIDRVALVENGAGRLNIKVIIPDLQRENEPPFWSALVNAQLDLQSPKDLDNLHNDEIVIRGMAEALETDGLK